MVRPSRLLCVSQYKKKPTKKCLGTVFQPFSKQNLQGQLSSFPLAVYKCFDQHRAGVIHNEAQIWLDMRKGLMMRRRNRAVHGHVYFFLQCKDNKLRLQSGKTQYPSRRKALFKQAKQKCMSSVQRNIDSQLISVNKKYLHMKLEIHTR